MNSISRGYNDPCRKEKREEKECKTIVKCGCPSSVILPTLTVVGTTVTLASLTLDTSCLCDADIKLEFASNIIATGFRGALSIRIFKQCRDQFTPAPIGPESIVVMGAAAKDLEPEKIVSSSKTFSFFVCDSDSCQNDCCTYTAVATVTTLIATGTISINNATLGAIATCKERCNECK